MRAGRLEMRRYRVRRNRRRVLMVLLVLGLAAYLAHRNGLLRLPDAGRLSLLPAATASPEDTAADTAALTLTGQRWYALSVGAFDDAAAAHQTAEGFRARGAGGYVTQEEKYYVLAAAYLSRSDAQLIQRQLKDNHNVDTVQREIAWPEIQLRLSGQKSQIAALTDACAALEQLPEQLSALSQGLDQQTVTSLDARAVLLSHRDTLSALGARLDACFDVSAPAAVAQLKAALSSLAGAMDAAQGLSGSARLGGQIKYCHLAAVCLLQEFASLLAP